MMRWCCVNVPSELGYTVYRRDRSGQKGGELIILIKSEYQSEENPEFKTECENLWVQLNLSGSKHVLLGAYYKPHEFDQHSFDELNKSFSLVKQTNSTTWLLDDFNLPKVDWEMMTVKPDCSFPTFYRECLKVFNDCLLEQMMTSPTRGHNILDLIFTSNPAHMDKISVSPGVSDHDIVIAEINTRPARPQQPPPATSHFIEKQTGTS